MKLSSIPQLKQTPLLVGLLLSLALPLASCSSNSLTSETGGTETSTAQSDNAIQVGVLVNRDIEFARQRYGAMLDYLAKETGRAVTLIPLTQQSQFIEVERGSIDILISNPVASTQLQRLYGTELLASQSLAEAGTQLGGLIIVRSDSTINQLQDLANRKGACVSLEAAAGGCLFQMLHLQENNINPLLDLGGIVEIDSQDEIVKQVIAGDMDFGFIHTGQLESMINRGLLSDASQVRILDAKQENGFTFEHTTRLYPGWAVSAASNAGDELVSTISQAVLNLSADSSALEGTGIEGFVPPVDYSSIDQLIQALKLRSWDAQ